MHLSYLRHMANPYFQFRQFRIDQKKSGMKVTTDACVFGAWVANEMAQLEEQPKQILDLGTGTGLLALMLAQNTQNSELDAVEVNEQAYQEAKQNFDHSPWKARLRAHHTSIQQFDPGKTYDLIICNPPFFVNHPKSENASKNQALHSTDLPFGPLLQSILRLLTPTGSAYLLYPQYEMDQFVRAAPQQLFPTREVRVFHAVNRPVFRVMNCFQKTSNALVSKDLYLKNRDEKYSDDCWQLLKPYYLPYNDPKNS